MKKIFTLFAVVIIATTAWSQAPETMSYQAVIRNSSNNLVTDQAIGMKISILHGSIEGTPVYVEIYNPNPVTNANGLITIEIGGGIALTGNFSEIDWPNGPYFIMTETDPSGGTNYSITGISQLLSVPYAFSAGSAEKLTGEISGSQIPDILDYIPEEADPAFTAWDRTTGIEIIESQITDMKNYLTEEVDPLFISSSAAGIELDDIDSWNAAYGWGDHSEKGYLTGYTETDPDFQASAAAGITITDIDKWNTRNGLININAFTNNCPGSLTSITATYQKVADLGTFAKESAASTITVNFNGRLYAETTSHYVRFELRINNEVATQGVARALLRSQEAGHPGIHASITGIWKDMPAGNYTISIYAQGTGTDARVDPGCFASSHTVVTELQ